MYACCFGCMLQLYATILHPCLLDCLGITCIIMTTTTSTINANTTIIHTNPNPLYSSHPQP